ncbi:hypothetical protein [Streptomyces sp. cg2]|uniref:hypothetical protein n=1 Tax=Streptomyces sp. cg2 TaxID=3238799 RepID=UPI0034E2CC5B
MKFRTRTEYQTEPRTVTVDGKSHTRMAAVPVQVPQLPRDWDQIALRAVVAVVMALTTVAVAWSTYSIGAVLQGGIGYLAASVFDAAWIVNILLEYLGRFDPKKRKRNKCFGWALLAATMGAILWHGLLAHSIALGIVGAAVSLFAKMLWLSIMTYINKDLSEDHQAWVKEETSEAHAKIALSQVRRASAKAEAYAAAELLAAERIRNQYAAAPATPAVPEPESTRGTRTLGQAVRAILADDGHRGLAPGAPMSQAAEDAIAQALADGWTSREVYDAAIHTQRATTTPRRRDVTTAPDIRPQTPPETPPGVRPEVSGYPLRPVSAQASGPDEESDVRPDVRPAPQPREPQRDEERVPEQRPPSLAKEVKRLVFQGVTDASVIAQALAARVGREPGDPTYQATVGRYVRDAARQAAEPDDGLGRTYL